MHFLVQIFYFDIFSFGDGKNILDLIEPEPENDINYFYSSYYYLENLYLYFYNYSGGWGEYYSSLKAKEIKENVRYRRN